jgi:hypothetical protein
MATHKSVAPIRAATVAETNAIATACTSVICSRISVRASGGLFADEVARIVEHASDQRRHGLRLRICHCSPPKTTNLVSKGLASGSAVAHRSSQRC